MNYEKRTGNVKERENGLNCGAEPSHQLFLCFILFHFSFYFHLYSPHFFVSPFPCCCFFPNYFQTKYSVIFPCLGKL